MCFYTTPREVRCSINASYFKSRSCYKMILHLLVGSLVFQNISYNYIQLYS